MRTTVDLPDDVYRRVKASAALQGITVRTFLLQSVEARLHGTPAGREAPLPLIKSTRKKKINPTRKQLEDAMFG
jgi:hypothetical protein